MRHEKTKLQSIYLRPGEMYFTTEQAVVTTLLGSCVSVTMFNRQQGIGSICHGLLPRCGELKSCDGECLEGLKYVECAIRRMIKKFDSFSIIRSDIEVKLFGGADMFGLKKGDTSAITVGRENIVIAKSVIEADGLRITASDTGGSYGRKILFYTHTGDVYLKRIKQSACENPRNGGRRTEGFGAHFNKE